MTPSIQYASFLIRFWNQTAVEPPFPASDWHSEVERIQTGEVWTFSSPEELLDFLRQQTEKSEVLVESHTD